MNIQNFAKATMFQKMITSILINLKTDKNDMKELKHAFQEMDQDNNGVLTLKELENARETISSLKLGQPNEFKAIMKKCDLDGDGKIDF